MTVNVTVDLLTGVYDAGDACDPSRAEWPPHPARLFCAFLAAARGEEDLAALRWLEHLPPPTIHTSTEAREHVRAGYVVTNEVVTDAKSQSHLGRTNGLRVRASTIPASPRVQMIWEADADPHLVGTLDAIAARIPYLGRSTGVALVSAAVSTADDNGAPAATESQPDTAVVVHEPCDLGEADGELRVPYPGYLAELVALHSDGRPAWEASRLHGYRRRGPAQPDLGREHPVIPSAYCDLVVYQFTGIRPDGRLAGRFTEALRSAVLHASHGNGPVALHGHGADGRPHVAFLALPDVGGEHGDGHLLGLAVAVPDLPNAERQEVLRAALGLRGKAANGAATLTVAGLGVVDLAYKSEVVRPWGANPDRWRRGSTRWASATPIILDRYPKGQVTVEDEITRSCHTVGLPTPTTIEVSRTPLLPGAVHLQPVDIPRKLAGRPFMHVRLEFDRTVSGPVLLGAGRYLGIGLLAPLTQDVTS